MPGLTRKQEAFAVLIAKGEKGADAYRGSHNTSKMTQKSVHESASRLLRNAKVAARVSSLKAPAIRNAGLSVERTLTELSHVSHVDPRRFYRGDGTMKEPGEWDDDMAAAVSSVEAIPVILVPAKGETEAKIGYNYKIKFWDKNAGLEKSMKHLGLFEKDNAQSRESLTLNVEAAKPVKR